MRRGHFNKPSMAGGRLLKIKDEKDTTFLNIMPNKLTHTRTPVPCTNGVAKSGGCTFQTSDINDYHYYLLRKNSPVHIHQRRSEVY